MLKPPCLMITQSSDFQIIFLVNYFIGVRSLLSLSHTHTHTSLFFSLYLPFIFTLFSPLSLSLYTPLSLSLSHTHTHSHTSLFSFSHYLPCIFFTLLSSPFLLSTPSISVFLNLSSLSLSLSLYLENTHPDIKR